MYKRGYTLIEALIYIALLIGIAVILVQTLIFLSSEFRDAKKLRIIHVSAENALERIVRELRFADDISIVSSVFDTHPGTLVLSSIDPATETPQTITISSSGTQITLQKGSGSVDALTPATVDVENIVYRLITTPLSKAVKVELRIDGKNFYTTALLRRSY
jgi:type II secretory pathway pseudopilin PulG